jgi:phage shock protein C
MEETRLLRRSKSDRMLFGVCGGLGQYFEVDPVWFRLGFVLTALPGGVPGLVLYLIFFLVMPEEDTSI